MKLLVLLLAAVAVAPVAVPAPSAGQGDAAAAVAAAGAKAPLSEPGGLHAGSVLFTISGAGKMLHLEGGPVAGQKPFKTVLDQDDLIACINGTGTGCDSDSIDINATSFVFLIWQSPTSWLLANNGAGIDGVELEGLVDGKGGFMMAGTHTSADGDTHILLTGKVKFEKGTLNPLKISGKFSAVSTVEEHYGKGTFKAVIAPA